MNLKLEEEFSKAELLKDIDALKAQVDALRPLPPDVEGRVMQKLRLDWNYHSNAIEGNKLNYGETVAFLMEGITAKGKPLKDHLDIRGHNEAINFLLDIVKDVRPVSEADIRALHAMILVEPYDSPAKTAEGLLTTKRIKLGEYKTSPNHVKTATGEIHYYATPEETPAKMQELMAWYAEAVNDKAINVVVIAALFHHKFVAIHPFDDGNGRLSRILMNLILMQKGYPPVVVKIDNRTNYYSLLSRADVGDSWPFIEYIAELLQDSLQLYLKAADGGDIDEDDDVDKEIALFKMEIINSVNVVQKRSNTIINNIFALDIQPLIIELDKKIQRFSDLFFGYNHSVVFQLKDTRFLRYDSIDQFVNTSSGKDQESILTELHNIGVIFRFKGFKNSENDFNLEIWITIKFEEYHYSFFDFEGNVISKKLYHQRMTLEDKNRILKSLINDFKMEVNKKQKSPKQ